MKKTIRYIITDILKSKFVIAYTIMLLVLSVNLFLIEDVVEKSLMSILTLNLIFIPLVSLLFSTIYIYNSAEFIELLSAQPVKRGTVWISFFIALSLSLGIALFIGCGIPILIFAATPTGLTLVATGLLLSIIFVALALFIAVYVKDKTKGIGLSLIVWLYFTIIFDGLVLFLLFQLLDYPVEKLVVGLSFLNPVDLSRILTLLKMDISALMGATAAVFKNTYTGSSGFILTYGVLTLWVIVPLYYSIRKFKKKDL